MLYAIRISRSYEELEQFFISLADSPILAVFEHPQDEDVSRTHVHALLDTQLSTDTLKHRIKKFLNVTVFPKTDWSFTKTYKNHHGDTVDVNLEFITYMSKGILQPKQLNGIVDWKQYADKWVQPKQYKGLKQFKLITERPEVARKRQTELLQPIIENIAMFQTSKEIVNAILDVLRKEKVIVGRYKIRDYYDYVMNARDNKEWREDIFYLCTKV